MYGPDVYELILKNHLLYKINENVDFSFINVTCEKLYCSNKGRPVTNTPEMMLRSAVVQYLFRINTFLEEAKRYSKSRDFKRDMKMRAHIEPKQGEMKRFHGLKRAKFWGKEKMNIQAMLTGIAVNLKRFIKMSGDIC
ncbi:DDE family transposase [Methanohalophilus euhalobius]|uniref:DDE family transposase n=1 Tax=Methanohalophilus euhalobius TaxID=51203 RepID=A0A285F5B5_9EURY|nr:MAG: transposase [Methanohalophilus sp. 2-GBenrich]RSD33278.1 MAG: hypothetical protein CI952_1609 [Methanohalophilus sp.]RXG33426.1 hypothetical protein CI957_1918 [Methanohalophilus sp. WG1-DM]TCL12254.1 DDE family transposase [Methanohalophilus euhalobius]SNY06478.1 Transposase DDE domain-containing protein [Methanohalophilus euhalobius]